MMKHHMEHEWEMPAIKRLRTDDNDIQEHQDENGFKLRRFDGPHAEKHDLSRSIEHMKASAIANMDSQIVAPFMAKHIPAAYAPQGVATTPTSSTPTTTNTKFCYRHRPDMLCRRQADEPSMDKLQRGLEKLSESDRQGIVQVWSLFSAAPSRHRDLMLQGILTQCCFPQLSFLSTNVQKLVKIDFLSALPPEISFRILSSLDTISLCKAAQVSTRWRQLADDDVVWHRMCEQHIDRKCTKCGWGLPLLDRKRLRASKRQMQLRAAWRGQNAWSPTITPVAEIDEEKLVPAPQSPPTCAMSEELPGVPPKAEVTGPDSDIKTRPWKHVYRDRFRVGKNWKHGICSTKILKGHTNGIMAVQMLDNVLATGSYDNTIKIWDLDTGSETRTLSGHTLGIRCLQFDEKKLISGSMDGTLRVWNWRTGDCLATYNGHHGAVIGLHFDSNILVSGSVDATAMVWNFEDKSRYALRGHTNWVNSVRIDTASRTVFTGSDDMTARLWDLDTKQCIRVFKGHVACVQQVVLLPREFDADDEPTIADARYSGSESPRSMHTAASSTVSEHDQSPTLLCRSLLFDRQGSDAYHSTFTGSRPEPPRYMLTSALDNTIRMWDVSTGRCVRTFFGHVEGVWALAADGLRIVSGAEDRMTKVWDPRTGKCERTFTGHSGPVTCIGLSDSRMCSAGEDGEARVYCFNDSS